MIPSTLLGMPPHKLEEFTVVTYTKQPYQKRTGDTKRRKYRQDYYASNKGNYRNTRLLRLYGIEEQTYNRLVIAQHGLCAICYLPAENNRSKRLYVDHDHTTSKVRGLLCHRCNLAVGYYERYHTLIEKYLE